MRNLLKLYLVTDRELSCGRSLEEVVTEAVAGGVTIVQLREKDASTGEFVALASRLLQTLRPLGIPLIINDRVDVALAVDADGVHIGQSDMPYEHARRLLGPDKIIGLSERAVLACTFVSFIVKEKSGFNKSALPLLFGFITQTSHT